MTLEGAIQRIQAIVGGISGIREAPDFPDGQMSVFPFSVCWVETVNWFLRDGSARDSEGEFRLEIHWKRGDLKRDVAYSMDFSENIPNEILSDPTLSANVDILSGLNGGIVPMRWGTTDTIGWRFTLPFRYHAVIT